MEKEKNETIFRQKSVDRVSSPEQLDNYLKVTTPTVWLVLVGIIIILIGTIVWAAFGRLHTYANAGCLIEDQKAFCYVTEEDFKKITTGMMIELPKEEQSFEIVSMDTQGVNIPDSYNYLQHIVGVTADDYVFMLLGFINLEDGYYPGRVVTESISPLEFIFN